MTEVLTLGPHLFDGPVELVPLETLPPFASPIGDPAMTYAHLAGPVGAPGEVGLWTCDRGGFTYSDTPAVEAAILFEGVARITDADGNQTVLRAGEGYRLPIGWSGSFEALDPVKKVFFIL